MVAIWTERRGESRQRRGLIRSTRRVSKVSWNLDHARSRSGSRRTLLEPFATRSTGAPADQQVAWRSNGAEGAAADCFSACSSRVSLTSTSPSDSESDPLIAGPSVIKRAGDNPEGSGGRGRRGRGLPSSAGVALDASWTTALRRPPPRRDNAGPPGTARNDAYKPCGRLQRPTGERDGLLTLFPHEPRLRLSARDRPVQLEDLLDLDRHFSLPRQ